MEFNNIGDIGAIALATALEKNYTLTTLVLYSNYISVYILYNIDTLLTEKAIADRKRKAYVGRLTKLARKN